jgi:hypothetical protein
MTLPPKGDPQRPLHLATRLTRVLGTLFVVLGLLSVLPYVLMVRGRGLSGLPVFMASGVMFHVSHGAVYLVGSIFLARRKRWAVVVALAIDALDLALAAFGLVMVLIYAPWVKEPLVLVPIGMLALFAYVFAALGYYLSKSFRAIREAPPELNRGFEPLPPAPVIPVVAMPGGTGDQPVTG